ncbi:MAG: hypothetical protein FJZ67_08525 [Bacteroidetes bacterium]|nr:hypothetical protein [Bacteroidota bacterium]
MKNSIYSISITVLTIFISSCTKDKVGGNLPYPEIICSEPISFNNEILPIIQNNCTGCHDNQNGYTLTNYQNIKSNYSAIVGAMKGQGFLLMPDGGPALPDSIVEKIQCWVNQGLKNN